MPRFLILGLVIQFLTPQSLHAINAPEASALDCKESDNELMVNCSEGWSPSSDPQNALSNDQAVCSCISDSKIKKLATSFPIQPLNNTATLVTQKSNYLRDSQLANAMIYATTEEEANQFALSLSGTGIGEPGPNALNLSLAESNSIPNENESWQCVTFNEFNAFRSLPESSGFYRSLRDSTFNIDNWNMSSLVRSYDLTTSEADRASLAERIQFLQQNPHLRSIFSATPTSSLTSDRITEIQRNVYTRLQRLAPPEGAACFTNNNCKLEVIRSGAFEQFRREFNQQLLNNTDLHDISNQVGRNEFADLVRTNESPLISPLSQTPESIEEYILRIRNDDPSKYQRCLSGSFAEDCAEFLRNHCRVLSNSQRNRKMGLDVLRIAREQDRSDLILDLQNNLNFEAFNDQICLQQYQNSQGESLNFFGYQNQNCSGENPLPECQDRTSLLSRFLKEYNQGDGSEGSDNRMLVAELIDTSTFAAATREAVATASLLNETPAELRRRFGGSYPLIGPAGELLPPPPSNGSGSEVARNNSTSAPSNSPGSSISPISSTTTSAAFTSADSSTSQSANRSRISRDISPPNGRTSFADFSATPLSQTNSPNVTQSRSPASDITPNSEFNRAGSGNSPPNTNQDSNSQTPINPSSISSGQPRRASQAERSPRSITEVSSASGPNLAIGSSARSPARLNPADQRNSLLLQLYTRSGNMQILPNIPSANFSVPYNEFLRYQRNPDLLSKNLSLTALVRSMNGEIVEIKLQSPDGQDLTFYGRLKDDKVIYYETLTGAERSLGRPVRTPDENFVLRVNDDTFRTLSEYPQGILLDSNVLGRIESSNSEELRIFLRSQSGQELTLLVQSDSLGALVSVISE